MKFRKAEVPSLEHHMVYPRSYDPSDELETTASH